MKELEQDNLQEVLANNELVLVQYGAGWCGNCKIMKPKFKKFASEHTEIPFYYVDAEKFPESRKLAKVDNLPTFVAFKNGEAVQQIQTNKGEVLKQMIDEVTAN
ncbi:co-chaperone YbbN [Ornithobacterium rhinotracheale]|uniref:thioredoxin family protein n=2 Tax=Ornithobacterium rhinotracheale TaxID=28251 RepID=UPI001FF5BAA6|nr:thioredoxin family protein [Ornithobacterium rhinotracheale]MCK0199477.1 thioredoxin family protein [Ornithobacterium rhinotracheale]MCK0205046.1 thioredoxin family protein [Ornithobacterium rhinotracheale]UVD88017.1 thioredoxin family protein [Ornithobacterium rhinotracheale]